jgi:antitoxin CptB
MTETNSDADRRGRLRYRSWHRGTREMDLLMGSFADTHIGTFTALQLDQYEDLLHFSDPDLYNWITGSEELPNEHASEIMKMLCLHRYAKNQG